ncbi:ABC transporter permease subunit [Streptomyces sp. JH002]|uniref:ABC transporter permease n=1 Tax=Streptomyces xiamenensis TaxID=408015 RepID=A0A0F7FWG0_9ACTN|nr:MULTISPECIES: ABC transporter permease subunit [Streptomyces]AKG44939.1 ABC transporter permease [Streptomyces xiamenensis]
MSTVTAVTVADPETRQAGFGRLMQSEWTKIRSVRSTIWSLALLLILFPGFTAGLVALAVSEWDNTSEADLALIVADPAGVILASGFLVGQLAICVLGVLVIASEYSTGMIRASLLAVPRRVPMLAAKATVFSLLVLAVSVVAAFASFFIGAAMLEEKAPVSLGDPGVFRAVVGSGLYLAVLGLFALAIGAIFRHPAAGITGVIAFVFVVAPMAQLLPGKLGEYLNAYLPTEAGPLIGQAVQGPDDLLSPWQGFGVLCLWTAALLALAAYLLKRRDA